MRKYSIRNVALIGVLLLAAWLIGRPVLHCYKTRTRRISQEFNCIESICIRVIEYSSWEKRAALRFGGTVELRNATEATIGVIPLFRVVVKDANGAVVDAVRREDAMGQKLGQRKIQAGCSERYPFDGSCRLDGAAAFAVRWDGNKSLITKWIQID